MADEDSAGDKRLAKSYLAAGFLGLGGAVAAGAIAGSYLDGYLGTGPWFTLLLTLGTMVGAVYRLLWMLNHFGRDDADGGG